VDEDTKEFYGGPSEDEEDSVPPSQASQLASSMLRETPKSRGKLTQSRIVGRVSKPGGVAEAEKRRLISFGGEKGSPSKRGRVGAVGLGIGMPGERRA
jgi:hypothetical protein